jgi:hypothetical protein
MFKRKGYFLIAAGILIIILAILFLHKPVKEQPSTLPLPTAIPSNTPMPSQFPTPSLAPKTVKLLNPNATSVPGGTRGQITCDYKIPAGPNEYGTASIESNWNNLVLGKNGSAKLDVCVSVNSSSSLMASDNRVNGSRVDSAPWISLSTEYVFTLYDDHGGDLLDCGGTVLDSCNLTSSSINTPAPASNGFGR